MSRGANMSILGLYYNDSTIWDLMQFPEGFSQEQKQTTIDSIMAECAELEILYPNPTVMKNMIGLWSKKENPYWSRIYNASRLEYNPIENYRRNETEKITDGRTEQHSGSDTSTASGSDALARTGTETDTESGTESLRRTGTDTNTASGSDTTSGSSSSTDTNSGTDTVNNKITGFDSDTLVPHDSSETLHGLVTENEAEGTNTQTYGRVDTTQHNTTDTTTFGKVDTIQHNTTDTTTYGKQDTFQHGEKIEHEGETERSVLAYGNIGVTTSQQMLEEEMKIAKEIQIIPIIIESFQDRFCLMVY